MIAKTQRVSVHTLAITSIFVAMTLFLAFTPIGMIRLPLVSFTIAHIPAIVAAVTIGLFPGLVVALTFGLASLFLAATSASNLLDPFFVNPLISILPRLLIPVTAHYTYRLITRLCKNLHNGSKISAGVAVVVGNLTNTFGVYSMLYLIYAREILEKSGKPALTLIIGALSTTTVFKTIGIVIIATPIIYAVNKTRGLQYGKSVKNTV